MQAAVIGATGLIGGHVLDLLEQDNYFSAIQVITRRSTGKRNSKIKEWIIDFDDTAEYARALRDCDVIFSAVGTTQKNVKGDKDRYRKIDFDIPVNAARIGKQDQCSKFLFVSSVGADSNGNGFYLKLKGEVEDAIRATGIETICAFEPSMLLGNRQESRPAERFFQVVSKAITVLLPSKYKPIEAQDVARAMVKAAKTIDPGFHVLQYAEMKALVR